MQAGPAGFQGAPVTKALLAVVGSSSLLVQTAHGLRRRVPRGVGVFVDLFVFRHVGELIFGGALLYYFRVFERQNGPSKYGSFCMLSLGLSFAVQALVAYALGTTFSSGPYALIAANFVSFVLDIPPVHKFTLFGYQMTDKAFIYMAGLQLFLSSPRRTLSSLVSGALIGIGYRSDFLGMRRLKVPAAVSRFFGQTLGPLLGSRQAPAESAAPASQPPRPQPTPTHFSGASAPAMPAAEPEAVAQLVAMGFEPAQAENALRQCQNNIQLALSHLL